MIGHSMKHSWPGTVIVVIVVVVHLKSLFFSSFQFTITWQHALSRELTPACFSSLLIIERTIWKIRSHLILTSMGTYIEYICLHEVITKLRITKSFTNVIIRASFTNVGLSFSILFCYLLNEPLRCLNTKTKRVGCHLVEIYRK